MALFTAPAATRRLTVPDALRVLLLEDVVMDAELIEYELSRAGVAFTSKRVTTARAFEAALGDFRPDLILSDFTLPGFDGMAALALAQRLAPTVPFIVVTGSINEETAVRCMRAGADDYLLKNSLARIGPAIDAALERKRATQQKRQAEAALRRSEAHLRAVFNNALQDFVLIDPSGIVLTLNKTRSDWPLWVCGRDILEGDRITDLLPESIAAEWTQFFPRALAKEVITIERQVVGPESEERWFEASFIPVVDDGEVVGVCLSVMNIDERKRSEEQLRRTERMQAVGRLAGGMAHEVNNMMTVIRGFGDFLLKDLAGDDERRRDVEEINRAADRAADVTRQLLAFSRQQILQPRVLEANAVVTGAEGMLRRLMGETVRLSLRLAPVAGAARADLGQLEQVLVNLALNARDAMPDGGRVTIETTSVLLDEAYIGRHADVAIPPGSYVMIAMSDTGQGMDSVTLTRIFEPFFTTKPVGQGTGLGLSTVYGIVKQSGGFVWAYSEVGIGTTFKVYLPAVPEGVEGASPTPAMPLFKGGTEIVVVVEDDDMVRSLACRALREHGYRVLEARHGREAISLLAATPSNVDLVISDVVMPEMGGRELAERLALVRPGLPILFMSGYTGDDVVQRGLLDQDAPFQQKPFTPSELASRVRQVLDRARAARAGDL